MTLDSVFIGTLLYFNLIVWGVCLLLSEDLKEGVARALVGSVFITLLCISVYLMSGGM